jgi:oxaloacetate decarboxylase alpha subunit
VTHIAFVDQTLRDGHQSLWGLRLRAIDAEPALEHIDRSGFRVVDVTGSAHFAVLVRQFRDNPWDNLDLLATRLPSSRLRTGTRTNSTVGFALQPYALVDLITRLMVRHGVGSFWMYDCLYNMPDMERLGKVVRDEGAEVVPSIMFGLSDVHTDEFFAERVREIASWNLADAIYFEDAPGVLTPERARTLVPALLEAAGDIPIELHSHTTTGLAPLVYIEGIRAGIEIIHTASRPLANGPSIPSTESMIDILDSLGWTHDLDVERLPPVAEHFYRLAGELGYEVGIPAEYSLRPYEHQLPGGMTGTLKNQLAEYGMADRLDEVLEEIAIVHKELGKPVMATPFSQLIGIQSVLNIVTGERYSVVPNEVTQYAYGHYGAPPSPIDPEVMERIAAQPMAKTFEHWERPQPSLEEIRRRFGSHLSDEELCLRTLMPGAEVDAMLAAGPARADRRASASAVVSMVRELAEEAKLARRLSVSVNGLSITLARKEPVG